MTAPTAVSALQGALAAEHVAIYGYGVLGPRLPASRRQDAQLIMDAHRARRDRLRSDIRQRGGNPVPAAAGYHLPFAVTSAGAATRLAALLENGVVTGYTGLAGAPEPALRRYAALAMQEAAVRAVGWSGTPPAAFPGLSGASLAPKPEG